jgi:predicted nucleotide-binding protein
MLEEIKDYWNEDSHESKSGVPQNLPVTEQCIFIGHGRSPLWARLQVFLESDLGLKTVNYESESRAGESIITILEQMLNESGFAVLILTAEDETASKSKRARQNVIHEAGLFQGRLGFKKAILLVQDGLEEFSNVAGLQHIPFSGDRIEQTFYELQRVLKREGLIE